MSLYTSVAPLRVGQVRLGEPGLERSHLEARFSGGECGCSGLRTRWGTTPPRYPRAEPKYLCQGWRGEQACWKKAEAQVPWPGMAKGTGQKKAQHEKPKYLCQGWRGEPAHSTMGV